jgi:hypothetical protein
MSFLLREFNRLGSALHEQENANKYDLLYAAQQAIAWASDPDAYKSPFVMITGIQGEPKGCSGESHPPRSSDICDQRNF